MQRKLSEETNDEIMIVQIEPPQAEKGGDYYYRTYAPSFALSQELGTHVINLSNISRKKEELAILADILILKNICDPDVLPLLAERKKLGRISLYEIADDLGAIPAWNPVHFFYQNRENISLFKKTAASCDGIQFSVNELQRKYGCLNSRTAVFANQISIIPPPRENRQNDLVIGWGGSHGHLEDMKVIAPALTGWLTEHPDTKLYLMCSKDIWELFGQVKNIQKKLYPTGSLETYYAFLRDIDIGLAPLNDTAFNCSRSDVKFLEYAVSEVVPVLQNLIPYREAVTEGLNGFLYDGPAQLIAVLDRLYVEPQLRNTIARRARNYVLENRLQKDHSTKRLDFYRSFPRRKAPRKTRINEIFNELEKETGTARSGRYLRLMPTAFETSLYDGLILSQIDRDKSRARLMFDRAKALQPNNYLAYLFGACVMPDAIESLQEATRLNPLSIKSLLLLGEQYAAKNDYVSALKYIESAARLFPAYEIPYLTAAKVMNSLNQTAAAQSLIKQADELRIN
jgi:hypothetical protein